MAKGNMHNLSIEHSKGNRGRPPSDFTVVVIKVRRCLKCGRFADTNNNHPRKCPMKEKQLPRNKAKSRKQKEQRENNA